MINIKDFLFKNQTVRQTILKNAFWRLASEIVGRALRAIIVIYAARILGVEGYGVLTYAIGFAALFAVFADLAIGPILTREIAKNPESREKVIAAALYLKTAFSIATYLAIFFIATRITPIPASRILLPFIGLSLVFDGMRQLGFNITAAMEKMQVEAGVIFISQLATVVLGGAALLIWQSALSLSVAYALGSMTGFVAIAWYLKNIVRPSFGHFDFRVLSSLLKDALPFAFLSVTGAILLNTDTALLGWLASIKEVGYYNAAAKPVNLLFIFPSLIIVAVFPALSRSQTRENGSRIVEYAIAGVNLLALPIVAGSLALSREFIKLLYGNAYLPAIEPFQILIWTVLVNYPAVVMGYAILTQNAQIKTIKYFGAAALSNIILNYLFIPRWGMSGAAAATLISQCIATAGYYIVIRRLLPFPILSHIWRPLIATLIMTGSILTMKSADLSPFFIVPIAALLYFLILKILKEPFFEEIRKAFRSAS